MRRKRRWPERNGGFTWVEVLIVVGVLLILGTVVVFSVTGFQQINTATGPDELERFYCAEEAQQVAPRYLEYQPRQNMTEGRVQNVSAELSSSSGGFRPLPGPHHTVVPVATYCKVTAVLDGAGFSVVSLDPADQSFIDKSLVQWTWQVTPEQAGNLTLTLTVSSTAYTPQGAFPTDVVDKAVSIDVASSPGQTGIVHFLADTGLGNTVFGVALAAVLAVIGFLIKRFFFDRKRKNGQPTDVPT